MVLKPKITLEEVDSKDKKDKDDEDDEDDDDEEEDSMYPWLYLFFY